MTVRQKRRGTIYSTGSSGGTSLLAFGAVGNGIADDTSALQNAFDTGGWLVAPAGYAFRHTAVLTLPVAGTHLSGPGVILATAEQTSSVWLAADNILVDGGLTFRMQSTTQRWDAYEMMKLRIYPSTVGVTIRDITVDGAASGGIYVSDASYYVISDVTVQNTQADAIHQTNGANNGQVIRPTLRNAGDDGVAVVSYTGEPIVHDIYLDSPQSYSQVGGRAYSVVGGQNITMNNLYSDQSASAALYISSEPNYDTLGVQGVTVTTATFERSNTDSATDHGAILLYGGNTGTVVQDVTISDVQIHATRSSASSDVGARTDFGSLSRVTMNNFTITTGPTDAYGGDNPSGWLRTSNWTKNGTPLADISGW